MSERVDGGWTPTEKLEVARELVGEVYSGVHDEKLEALLFNTVRPALDEALAALGDTPDD